MTKSVDEVWTEGAERYVDRLAGELELTTREEARAIVVKWVTQIIFGWSVWSLWSNGSRLLAISLAIAAGWLVALSLVRSKLTDKVIEHDLVPSRRSTDRPPDAGATGRR